MIPKPFAYIVLSALLIAHGQAATVGGTVLLTEQGIRNLGLQTVTVEEADFEATVFALGRTEAVPESRSVLSSRISGRVVESRLAIGASVSKDEKLVLIESRQPGNPSPTIWLTAPADGTVVSVATRLGAPVEPTDRLAEFADLTTLYLVATLPQAVAGRLAVGTRARVHFPVHPDQEYIATLLEPVAASGLTAAALGQGVGSGTEARDGTDLNTTGVVFTLRNPDTALRPGMSAECSIITESRKGVLSVPAAAIQGGPSNRHVYVKHPTIANAFDRVSVQTGLTSNGRVEILDGLVPGDEVVTRGSYSLGFAGSGGGPSLKEALDAAHGHEHNEDGSEKSPHAHAGGASTGEHDHDHDHDHHHDSHGIGLRELFFMASTGILAVLLVVTSLRRRSSGSADEPF
ncbi:hypothetical protein ASA1KI_09000 [Opitutales bacterium ASA1]|uniref:efflux RND transporter periplasmic adaptor subunit n=1 Tax=Congregicoccus parvus TaxID=3081749 RepID=UPI002B2EB45E|nr:hypothetical protein ASA1KI_09000 [Opitutales bacterium ASA1]